jgi:hypothetical protein
MTAASGDTDRYVFVIWPSARRHEIEILDDLAATFEVRALIDVAWSSHLFAENMTAFYGKPFDAGMNDKRAQGDDRPILVAVVDDPRPVHEYRRKRRRVRIVNRNVFERKRLYREWAGGGHRIHSSEITLETARDLSVLFGPDYARLLSDPPPIVHSVVSDVPSVRGWASLEELFGTLNSALPYVVLGGADAVGTGSREQASVTIELCVEHRLRARYLLNPTPTAAASPSGPIHAMVAGRDVRFIIREVGDGLFDDMWQANLIESRRLLPAGLYVPDAVNTFYARLYRALVHSSRGTPHALAQLEAAAAEAGIDVRWDGSAGDSRSPTAVLAAFMTERQYVLRRPVDVAVGYGPSKALRSMAPKQTSIWREWVKARAIELLTAGRLIGSARRARQVLQHLAAKRAPAERVAAAPSSEPYPQSVATDPASSDRGSSR